MIELERLARVAYPESFANSTSYIDEEHDGTAAIRERDCAIEKMRAVLEAMREPTDGMLFDAIETTDEFGSIWPDMPAGGNPADISKAVWQAMLKAAENTP